MDRAGAPHRQAEGRVTMNVATLVQAQLAVFDLLRQLSDHLQDTGHDVTPDQAVLVAAMPGGTTPIGVLARRCYAGTNLSYTIKKLEGLGYVTKETSQADLRSTFVTRTPAGDRLAAVVRGFLEERQLAAT